MDKKILIILIGVVLLTTTILVVFYFYNKNKEATSTSTNASTSTITSTSTNYNKGSNCSSCSRQSNTIKAINGEKVNNTTFSKSNYIVLDIKNKSGDASGSGSIKSIKIDGNEIINDSVNFEFGKQVSVNQPVKNGQSFVITTSDIVMKDDLGHKIVTKMIDNGKVVGNTIAIKI